MSRRSRRSAARIIRSIPIIIKRPMHSMRALPRTSCRSSGTAIRCRSASAAFPTPSPTGCTDANGSIYTEVLTQAQLRLMASGAVDLDRVEASIVLDAAGHLDDFALAHIRMIPVDVLNDPFRAAQQPGLISVNGCLMADLTGQVCAEAIDGRQYSGVGGQLDFVRAAARSVGGRSFLCLHSTHEAPVHRHGVGRGRSAQSTAGDAHLRHDPHRASALSLRARTGGSRLGTTVTGVRRAI